MGVVTSSLTSCCGDANNKVDTRVVDFANDAVNKL